MWLHYWSWVLYIYKDSRQCFVSHWRHELSCLGWDFKKLITIIFTFKLIKTTKPTHLVELPALTLVNSSSPRAVTGHIPSNPKAPANKLCYFEQIYSHWICCSIVLVLCCGFADGRESCFFVFVSFTFITYLHECTYDFFIEGCHI